MKICTSIVSGYCREYWYKFYDEIINNYNSTFVDNFNKFLSEDKIKDFVR
ncbi:MAG: hypothetical protein PHC28_05825 [Flavobacterium sp.]|nr:hypothetical protein [Flavobacterium sp.]MDD5149987.1 hypothetical protein [Flavobacterium sp.]